jgi:hypothetical protein
MEQEFANQNFLDFSEPPKSNSANLSTFYQQTNQHLQQGSDVYHPNDSVIGVLEQDIAETIRPEARMYYNEKLEHIPLSYGSPNIIPFEYPLKWDCRCFRCARHFEGIPYFVIFQRPPKESKWILNTVAQCSIDCLWAVICEKYPLSIQGKLWDNSLAFIREFIDPEFKEVGYIPLSAFKEYSPFGIYELKNHLQLTKQYTAVIRQPPCAFVPTWVETKKRETDLKTQITKEAKENFVKNVKIASDKKKMSAKNPSGTQNANQNLFYIQTKL